MGGHDTDYVENERCKLVGALCDYLDDGKRKGLYHLLDLFEVVLGYAGFTHGIKEQVCNKVHDFFSGFVLYHIDKLADVFCRILAEYINECIPLVGICADKRQDDL